MFENVIKKKFEFVGKFFFIMVDIILNFKKVDRSRIVMVGDRFYIDIKMVKDSGMVVVLVLFGEIKLEDVEVLFLKLDLIYGLIKDMYMELKLVFGG